MARMMISTSEGLILSTPTSETLSGAIEQALTTGRPHLTFIYRAMRDEGCDHLLASQNGPAFPVPLDDAPVIAVIGDDLYRSMGPSGFHRKSLRRLAKAVGAGAIMVGMSEEAYRQIVSWAVVEREHVLIVETRDEHGLIWLNYLRGLNAGIRMLFAHDQGETPNA